VATYLWAADQRDPEGLAACFTADATVLDEGVTYTGRDEIRSWREKTIGQWEYTTTVLGSESVSPQEFRVTVRLDGNFPGGTAEITQRFTLADGLISALVTGG
jgi:ketosteroid isomerase-like protein